MSITYVFTNAVNDGASSISKSQTITASADARVDASITGATTNQTVSLSAASALIMGIYMVADQALTVKTNTTTGVDTFALQANKPLSWNQNDPTIVIGDILSANITGLYVTNAGVTAATLRVRVALDATP